MNQAAITISDILKEIPNGISSFYWEIAPEDTILPFLTYSILEAPGASKDSNSLITTDIFIFAKNLTESSNISQGIRFFIKNSNNINWRFLGASSGYTTDEAKEGFIKLTFNFKL
jgi:hypothetical protein